MRLKPKIPLFHHYLGYPMAGLMSIYAFTGIGLWYRNTRYFKTTKHQFFHLEKALSPLQFSDYVYINLGLELGRFKVNCTKDRMLHFERNRYNTKEVHDKNTEELIYDRKTCPPVVEKRGAVHKTKINVPQSIVAGFSLWLQIIHISQNEPFNTL